MKTTIGVQLSAPKKTTNHGAAVGQVLLFSPATAGLALQDPPSHFPDTDRAMQLSKYWTGSRVAYLVFIVRPRSGAEDLLLCLFSRPKGRSLRSLNKVAIAKITKDQRVACMLMPPEVVLWVKLQQGSELACWLLSSSRGYLICSTILRSFFQHDGPSILFLG